MIDYRARNLYKGSGQYMQEAIFECSECGALVDSKDSHTLFHKDIQELKDKVWRAGLE